jgi:hypothetical protein
MAKRSAPSVRWCSRISCSSLRFASRTLSSAATLTLGALHGGPLAPERVRDEDRGAERRRDCTDVLDPEQVRGLHERRHRPDPRCCDEDDSHQLPPWAPRHQRARHDGQPDEEDDGAGRVVGDDPDRPDRDHGDGERREAEREIHPAAWWIGQEVQRAGDEDEVDRLHDADAGAFPAVQEQLADEDHRDAGEDEAQPEPHALEEHAVAALDEIR